MKLKANLHFHTNKDPQDYYSVTHSCEEGVDYAAALGFDVLAVTLHKKFFDSEEDIKYAALKNILLIKGIELEISKKHIVVLNCNKDIESVRTFEDLEKYKKTHPEIFIFAAHPYFHHNSLNGELERWIAIFDGIEFSWFYTRWFNWNKKGKTIAEKYNLPFIATSDTHQLDFLNDSYISIDVEEKTAEAIIKSLRQKKFENISSPRKLFKDIIWKWGRYILKHKMRC